MEYLVAVVHQRSVGGPWLPTHRNHIVGHENLPRQAGGQAEGERRPQLRPWVQPPLSAPRLCHGDPWGTRRRRRRRSLLDVHTREISVPSFVFDEHRDVVWVGADVHVEGDVDACVVALHSAIYINMPREIGVLLIGVGTESFEMAQSSRSSVYKTAAMMIAVLTECTVFGELRRCEADLIVQVLPWPRMQCRWGRSGRARRDIYRQGTHPWAQSSPGSQSMQRS